MNGYLLDTHIVLWSAGDTKALTPAMRAAIEAGDVWVSILALWEVSIKVQKGNLEMEDPWRWWVESLDRLHARALSLQASHIAAIFELPPVHRDPFDRALIAQALVEDLTLVSADRAFLDYQGSGLKLVG